MMPALPLSTKHRLSIVQWQHWLLLSIAFFIPLFPPVVPPLILIFGLLSVYSIAVRHSRAELSEFSVLLLLFFSLHLLGLLYTDNQQRGWFDLEVKLSMMAFPISFIGFKFLNQQSFRNTLMAFAWGTFGQALVSVGQSIWHYAQTNDPHNLIQSAFTAGLHPSYFSLYLVFAVSILVHVHWPFFRRKAKIRSVLMAAILLFAAGCVVLAASKVGLVMLLACALAITYKLLKENDQKWIPIVGLTVLISILGVAIEKSPLLQHRITDMFTVARVAQLNPEARESTAQRLLIYNASWQLATTQPWYGQGTGDFQDALTEVYRQNNYLSVISRQYNCHNLFFQTWISLGLPGLALLAGIFIVMLQQAMRMGHWLYRSFALLFFLISLTESSLNVQAGVIFFSFFGVLFSRAISAPSPEPEANLTSQ